MSILVVGSVGLDSITSPAGECRDALGGSAVYFSIAAGFFTKVNLVGVVGDDFPEKHRYLLEARGINLDGLEVAPGKTFRWSGSYTDNLNEAKTISTCLNVFGDFSPKLPRSCRESETVFLANISPKLQVNVLNQVPERRIVALDTMNYWINNDKKALLELLPKCDIFLLNEGEALQLTGEADYRSAARSLADFGPRHIILKRGEYGSLLISNGNIFSAPAYLVDRVADPTGAGDSFAGGVLGYLDSLSNGAVSETELRQAILYGAAVASFCVENFSVSGLTAATRENVEARAKALAETVYR